MIDASGTHSFIPRGIVEILGLKPTLVTHIYIEMLYKDKVLSNQMLLYERVVLKGWELVVDLIVFNMLDFDVILGIDFLSKYGAEISCKKKKV